MTQLIVEGEEIIPSEDEAKVQFKEAKEESFGNLVHEEVFKIFYKLGVTEDATTTSTLVAIVISTDQGTTEVPKGMVIEKMLPGLLSLLESRAGNATPKVPVVPRPPTPAPPLSSHKKSSPPIPQQHGPLALPVFKKKKRVSDTDQASKQITNGCTCTNYSKKRCAHTRAKSLFSDRNISCFFKL